MFIVSTSAGRSTVWARSIWIDALDGVAVQGLAALEDVEQLVDEPLDERDLGARTRAR